MNGDCPCCGEPRPPVRLGDLSVSLSDGVAWEGRAIPLSAQQAQVLHLLARRAPGAVHRDSLILSAMPEDASNNQLCVVMHHIRRKLSAAGVPLRIETLNQRGYRLVLSVAAEAS